MTVSATSSDYQHAGNSAPFVLVPTVSPTAPPILPPALAPELAPKAAAGRGASSPQPLAVDKCNVWGTDFARLDMQQTLDLAEQIIVRGHPEYFVTANLNYLMLTEQFPRLAEVNARSAAVIADGQPIVSCSTITGQKWRCPN